MLIREMKLGDSASVTKTVTESADAYAEMCIGFYRLGVAHHDRTGSGCYQA